MNDLIEEISLLYLALPQDDVQRMHEQILLVLHHLYSKLIP